MRSHGIRFESATAASGLERVDSDLRLTHLRIGLAVLASLLPAAGLLDDISVATQLAVVALPVSLLGVMHGAIDPWVGELLIRRRRFARSQRTAFFTGYLTVMSVVIACWVAAPLPTLGAFLALSVLHFGEQDACAFVGRRDALGVSVFGAIPVFAPIVGHPAEVAVIFDWLTGLDAARLEALLQWVAKPMVAIWLVGAGMLLSRLAIERTERFAFKCFGMAVLVAAMLLLPPLIAFAAYFCLLHSFGHLFDMAARGDGPWRRWSLAQWAARLWPATVATLALGLIGWFVLSNVALPEFPASEALAQVVFCGLAALTVPHVLLHELYRRERRREVRR